MGFMSSHCHKYFSRERNMFKYIKATAYMKRGVEIFTFCDMEHKSKWVITESTPPM